MNLAPWKTFGYALNTENFHLSIIARTVLHNQLFTQEISCRSRVLGNPLLARSLSRTEDATGRGMRLTLAF